MVTRGHWLKKTGACQIYFTTESVMGDISVFSYFSVFDLCHGNILIFYVQNCEYINQLCPENKSLWESFENCLILIKKPSISKSVTTDTISLTDNKGLN